MKSEFWVNDLIENSMNVHFSSKYLFYLPDGGTANVLVVVVMLRSTMRFYLGLTLRPSKAHVIAAIFNADASAKATSKNAKAVTIGINI
ncbi:MAG: hypothetical protein U5L01_11835 [Rheinheimera sp.]|nr:hypothetical protein [Rheinheimera sp.]